MSNKMSPTSTTRAGDTQQRFLTVDKSTTEKPACQSPIADLLHRGSSNAVPCRDLVTLTGWTPREITRAVERERRAGVPICANGEGYFIAANDAELDAYLRSLNHRLREVEKTRQALAASRQTRMIFRG